jgi:hypothetical protein
MYKNLEITIETLSPNVIKIINWGVLEVFLADLGKENLIF